MRRDVFQAIADPTRRDIIGLIGNGSMTLNEVADSFDVSRQAISKHIKILEECGIILISQAGRERYCSVVPERFNEVENWLTELRKMWVARFDRLDNLLEKMKKETKTKK